ncbi:MAG: hypothetical protein KUG64_10250 [Cycloclasticus sp.]|nr:hypothetical protein [Cycloclasticus sp.]
MKDSEERELIRTARNKAISVVVGLFITGVVALVIFYFTGTAALAQNSASIKEIKVDLKTVKTVPVLNQNKIKNIQKELKELKEAQKEFQKETKLSIKEMRKEQLKMLELLYQIKNQNN